MSSPLPVLRSPPFPHVEASLAAVSQRADTQSDAIPPARTQALLAAIRDARVGGSSWAPAAAAIGATAVLRPLSATDVDQMLAVLSPAEKTRPVVLLPRDGWAKRVANQLHRRGISSISGEVDPWPLMEGGATLHIHGDDELAALGHICHCPIRFHSAGRFGSAETPAPERERLIIDDLLGATRYRNPFTGEICSVEQVIEILTLWRKIIDSNGQIAVASGMAWWKRREIERFLWAPRTEPLRFTNATGRALATAKATNGGIAIWPSRVPADFGQRAADKGVPLIRVEDGFIRSIGLGSNLFPPFSVAVDTRGIHYDPSCPSDLEHLLETSPFSEEVIERAHALMAFIVQAGISKYGGGTQHRFPARSGSRRLVLVPGQVEDDMSVLLGGQEVAGNYDLIRRVRSLEPDAEIWFRPHPDVDAGHRRGFVADEDALRFADRVVRGGGMASLLDLVDGVHVLTSLTGFEALLRGRDVTTHGVPFYAGWGLTRDLAEIPARRTRRLTLAELVAGVLIMYPRYLDPVTQLPCSAETLVSRFAQQVRPQMTLVTALRRLQGRIAGRQP